MAWVPLVSYDFEDGTQGWTFGTGCGRSTTVGLEGSASIYVTQTTDTTRWATGPALPSPLTGAFRVRYLHKPASATGRNGYFYLRENGVARHGVLFIDGNIVQSSSGDALTTYTAGKVYEVIIEGDVAADKVLSISIRNITDGGTATVYTNSGAGFTFVSSASLTEIAIQAYSPTGSSVSYFDGIEPSTGHLSVFAWLDGGCGIKQLYERSLMGYYPLYFYDLTTLAHKGWYPHWCVMWIENAAGGATWNERTNSAAAWRERA